MHLIFAAAPPRQHHFLSATITRWVATASFAALSITTQAVHAGATTYSVTVIPAVQPTNPSAHPYSINANGDIAGTDSNHTIIVQAGRATDLGTLIGPVCCSDGFALNINDQVVGRSYNAAGNLRPVLWQNGTLQDLGGFSSYRDVEARGINTLGQIVGFAQNDPNNAPAQAWLYQGGVMTTLPTLGGRNATAQGINDLGEIVGKSNISSASSDAHATLWRNGLAIDLGALPGGLFSEALAINSNGVAVGTSTFNGGSFFTGPKHAAIFRSGTVVDLTPDLLQSATSAAFAINTAGQVVGYSTGGAYLWQNGIGTNLNTLIPSNLGILLQGAFGINDKGQIVASGIYRFKDLLRNSRIFLLTPN